VKTKRHITENPLRLFLIIPFFHFLISFTLYSQEPEKQIRPDETDLIDKVENIAENSDVSLDYTELLSDLKYYKENPLNLNSATADDLKKLIFLNNIQIYNILAYRENYGKFVSVYELQGIDGLDKETILKILPYITVGRVKSTYKPTLKTTLKSLKSELFVRYQRVLQKQQGYNEVTDSAFCQSPNSYYFGSPDKIYIRYGLNYHNKINFGITMEKDAGEPFLKSQVNDSVAGLYNIKIHNGFDFYSLHFSLSEFGHLKALTIGNYQLKFGQGLTMWSGLAFGKSSDATNIERFASGVRPYTSTDENGYLSGVASTFRFGKFDITGFYSSNNIDAGISEKDTMPDGENIATTIPETGYHRTISEIRKKDALNLKAYGGNLTYKAKRLKLGFTASTTHLSFPFLKDLSTYNKFDFTGSQIYNAGVNFNYMTQKVTIFGEAAYSDNGAIAQLYGITAYPHNRVCISLLYRDFPKDYHNIFSNPFSESGHTFNEQGIYSGINILLHKNWTLSAYIDNFRFPWLRYRVNSPSTGNDNLIQLNFNPSRLVEMHLRFRQKNKQINTPNDKIRQLYVINTKKTSVRYNIQYRISPTIVMKDRIEYLIYRESDVYRGTGYLIYHDLAWRPVNGRLSVVLRYALFDTDSYNERIYAYENDVLYAFSVPAYYYKGSRFIILLKLAPAKNVTIWFRFTNTYFSNMRAIGSGPQLIDRNNRSELKAQVRIKF
jgi:hypothetical protein